MTILKFYNNLTRRKENFIPIDPTKVLLYSCGPTTYDLLHIGNARALIVGDLFYRTLLAFNYQVNFVRNFTDVDDKIIMRSQEHRRDPLIHSTYFIEECQKDMESLDLVTPTHSPKVSETIQEIIAMITALIEKGHAYVYKDEVLFSLKSYPSYGDLARKDLDHLQHGIRVETSASKRSPGDFILWKKETHPSVSWKSPWGYGRPGWHIECSAMASKFLGKTIDIHHGGIDLLFPHHENERAQSESCYGRTFSHFWCHNELLHVSKEKMSKSQGNMITIRSFVQKYSGEVLRQLLTSVHYRSVIFYSEESIKRAITDVERIHTFIINWNRELSKDYPTKDSSLKILEDYRGKIMEALANDLNIPMAVGSFFSMIRLYNREYLERYRPSLESIQVFKESIQIMGSATGLISRKPVEVLEKLQRIAKKTLSADRTRIEELLVKRKMAKMNKDWKRSDEIRAQLLEEGIEIQDHRDKDSTWSYRL